MKKSLFIFLAVILISGLIFSGCANPTITPAPTTTTAPSPAPAPTTAPAPTGTIKIGFMSTMSGPFAAVENFVNPAVQMAIDNANASGGVLGRNLEIVSRDDQGDPSVAIEKLNELKAAGCVIIIGPLTDNMSEVMAQWAQENQTPVIITDSATMSLSTTKFNKYEFHTETNSLAFARLYAQNLSKQNITTIYEIGADMALAHEVHDFFWTEIQKVKPSVTNVGEAWVGGTEMDFSNLISAALAKNPDMIMSGVAGPPWVSFVQQAQRFNLFSKTKIVGIHLLGSDVTTSFGANYPVGIQGPSWCPFWLNEKPMQDFAQAYLAKTKLYPADITLEFYVAGLAAVAAIEKANSTDADAMIAALETTPFDTPVGTVQFHDYDHQLNLPVWYGSTGYTSDYPIAIGLNMTKYQDDIYPTKDEILALRAAK